MPWDWPAPLRLGPAHSGAVNAVAGVRLEDGRTLLVSAGADGSVVLWPLLRNGQVAGEPELGPRVRATSLVDNEDPATDALGRGVLAAHLLGLVAELVTKQGAGTAVVHIDGRWGAGKSSLVGLLMHRMSSPGQPTGTGAADGPPEGAELLAEPVVIRYDAWRESAVAPEWWSLARAVNAEVRSARALATRAVMTVTGALTRALRSRPVLAAALLLAVLLVGKARGIWPGDAEGLSRTLTAVASVAAVGLALGRLLFWSSPAFGWLHQRANDNPLGEIAAVVASLRRWSPRQVRGHRVADTLLGLSATAICAWYWLAYLHRPEVRRETREVPHWLATHAVPLLAAVTAAVLVAGSWGLDRSGRRGTRPAPSAGSGHRDARPASSAESGRRGARPAAATGSGRAGGAARRERRSLWWRRLARAAMLVAASAAAYAGFSAAMPERTGSGLPPGWLGTLASSHPLAWFVGALATVVTAYAVWTAGWLRRQPPPRQAGRQRLRHAQRPEPAPEPSRRPGHHGARRDHVRAVPHPRRRVTLRAHPAPAHADPDPPGPASPRFRPDVQQLLRYHQQNPVDIAAVARCFGRDYPPATAFTPEPPSSNGQVSPPHTVVNIGTANMSPADERASANPRPEGPSSTPGHG